MKKTQKKAGFKWGYIALMLITSAIGVCLLAFNNKSLDALAITIGAIVAVAGIIFAVSAISNKERGWGFGFKIAFSVALLICGITTMIARTTAINIMVGIFGLIIIMDGTFKFHTTALSKRYRAAMWWVMLVISVTLIAGGYITVRRFTIDWDGTVYVIGALFIVDAIANLLSAFFLGFTDKMAEEEIRRQVIAELEAEKKLEEEKAEKKAKKRGFFKRKEKQSK